MDLGEGEVSLCRAAPCSAKKKEKLRTSGKNGFLSFPYHKLEEGLGAGCGRSPLKYSPLTAVGEGEGWGSQLNEFAMRKSIREAVFQLPTPNNKGQASLTPRITLISFCYRLSRHSTSRIKSLITSPAIISPATDGTNEILPGICRRIKQVRAAPFGQTQWLAQLFSSVTTGVIGSSLE